MANDAKLGLILGVALVVLIGIVFFRSDLPAGGSQPLPPATALQPTTQAEVPDAANPGQR